MATETFIFVPVALIKTYGIFLVGLFSLGAGSAVLQTATKILTSLYWHPKKEQHNVSESCGFAIKSAGILVPLLFATREHCQNRVMFKQFLQRGAIDIWQVDSCRVGGANEVLSILLMAAKFNIPVCPHAGGVELCEYVQHLSMIDYICISGTLENRIVEYIDHLHEHFKDSVIIKNGNYMPPMAAG